MSEGKRPGGLTALAVLNFVFGGFGLLQVLGQAAFVFLLMSDVLPKGMDEEGREAIETLRELDIGNFMLAIAATGALVVGLQIASGIGYLKQKRLLGRIVGSIYALASIGHTVLMTYGFTPDGERQGFQLFTMVLSIYPALSLILINTTFKEDLTR
ncbi:MAG: hypothetical protein KDC98_12080 [Planctomycetes bacterium]|nr:hypothetical protein [Planctomycetota bacterium]